MRSLGVLSVLLASACASFGFGGDERAVILNLNAPADTVLRIAGTQLQHHGFQVMQVSEAEIITTPMPVPGYIRQASSDAGAQQWVVRVSASPAGYVAGSRVVVEGFLVPPDALLASTNQVQQNMIPVTSVAYPRLFDQLDTIADWITDATKRHRR